MFEALSSIKISIWIAVIFAALFRVIRMPSKATTWLGKIVDTIFTFLVSIGGGLMLYEPIMHYTGLGQQYEVVIAMVSALSVELLMNKILTTIKTSSLSDFIANILMRFK